MPRVLDRRIFVLAGVGILAVAPCYYLIAKLSQIEVSLVDVYLRAVIFIVALLMGYEFFFAVQTMTLGRPARTICSRIDKHIPFVVQWVWIYGFAYYGLLGLPIAFLRDLNQCLICIGGGFAVLLISAVGYLIWPSSCPSEWRIFTITGASARYLKFIQELDRGRNCCPSLHCALAAYTATFAHSVMLLFAIPALISASCLFVKQHSVRDLLPGLALGFTVGAVVNHLI